MDSRIVWLDAVKGVGMLLIMLVHMNAFPFDTQYLTAGYVAMFFVASGITFRVKAGIRSSIRGKALRLLVPYAFYAFGIVLVTYLMSLLTGKNIDIEQKLLGVLYSRYCLYPNDPTSCLLLNGGNSPLWFMTSLFTAFLFVFLWIKWKQSNVVLLVYCLLAVGMTQLPILLPWSLDMAPLGALLIIIGMKRKNLLCSTRYHVFFPLLLIVYIGNVYVNGTSNMSPRKYGNQGMTSTLFFFVLSILEFWIIAIVCRLIEHTRAASLVAYIGRSSLRLMCIHMFIWISIKDTLQNRLGEQWHLPLVALSLIVVFLLNYVTDVICNRWSKKFPILHYI